MGTSAKPIETIRLDDKYRLVSQHWSPKILGAVNDMHVKIAKIAGEFVWHAHEHEDELFLVTQGELTLRFRDQEDVVLGPGEMAIVPRGVEHLPIARADTHILMIEPATTVNTGDAGGDRTVEPDWI